MLCVIHVIIKYHYIQITLHDITIEIKNIDDRALGRKTMEFDKYRLESIEMSKGNPSRGALGWGWGVEWGVKYTYQARQSASPIPTRRPGT